VNIPAQTPNAGILVRQFASLSIAAGATLTVTTPAQHSDRAVLVASAANLSINPNGKLDLGGNDMIVHSGTIAPLTNLASITGLLTTGYSAGQWNGEGIASTAAHNNASHLTALGALLNTNGSSGPLYSTFDGVSALSTDVLIKYTYNGDANLDGAINGDDYALVDNGYNAQLADWENGDFNYGPSINASDYTMLDNAYNSAVPLL
jgi:hypothetical protein